MPQRIVHKLQQHNPGSPSTRVASFTLQIALWSSWTLAVLGVAMHHWYVARRAHLAVNLTGLMLDCILCGLVGLVVITKIEMCIEPWRFLE
jgi:hypothetical protein